MSFYVTLFLMLTCKRMEDDALERICVQKTNTNGMDKLDGNGYDKAVRNSVRAIISISAQLEVLRLDGH